MMILVGVPLPVLVPRLATLSIFGPRKSPEQRRSGARLQRYQLGFCDPSLGKANGLLPGKFRNERLKLRLFGKYCYAHLFLQLTHNHQTQSESRL